MTKQPEFTFPEEPFRLVGEPTIDGHAVAAAQRAAQEARAESDALQAPLLAAPSGSAKSPSCY